MATSFNVYAFDCGTTNWRISCLSCQEIITKNGASKIEPLGQTQPVALTTFSTGGHFLPAALLLDDNGEVQSYGQNAYDLACDPENLPYLRDAFKLCIGNNQPISPLEPSLRYSHQEALRYTQLLLSQILQQLDREKPGSLARESGNFFLFAHPVHWGRELSDGKIEGCIFADFVQTIKEAFPIELRGNIHFVPEPEGALLSLMRSGQLTDIGNKYTLVVDVGGGTTDFVVGQWTSEGLQDVRHYGGLHGGGLFDHNLAEYLADVLKVPHEQRQLAWSELRHYGQRLKESLSRQIQLNPSVSVTMKIVLELPGKDGESVFLSQKINFTNSDFENQAQNSIAGLRHLILKALLEMDLRKSDIAQVVLVGGGSHLYLVPKLLKETFGNSISVVYDVTAEQTVVQGVALWLTRPKQKPKKIAIFGVSGAGQSCYLLAMYETMRKGVNGFTLKAEDISDDSRFQERWKSLVDRRYWPDPMPLCSYYYDFTFNYSSRQLIKLDWLDSFRSAFIRPMIEETTECFVQYFKESSCIFLLIPSEALRFIYKNEDGEIEIIDQWGEFTSETHLERMFFFLKEMAKRRKPNNEEPFPVVIIITKYDLCPELNLNQEDIIEGFQKIFEPLFVSSEWMVMICPVSIGTDIEIGEQSEVTANIKPINVEKPLLFAIYCFLNERYKNKPNTNDKKYLNLLVEKLEGCPIYLGGQEVTLYV